MARDRRRGSAVPWGSRWTAGATSYVADRARAPPRRLTKVRSSRGGNIYVADRARAPAAELATRLADRPNTPA
jgi:hypothetical protein